MDNSVSIHYKNLQCLAIKIIWCMRRHLLRFDERCIPLITFSNYNIRNRSNFCSRSLNSVYHGTESFSYLAQKVWVILTEFSKARFRKLASFSGCNFFIFVLFTYYMEYGIFVWLLVGRFSVGGQFSEILGQFKLWYLETVSWRGEGGVFSLGKLGVFLYFIRWLGLIFNITI